MQTEILLSGFADEAANQKTMDQQFCAFAALGLHYVTLRFIDAGNGVRNLMQLDDAEIELVAGKLEEYQLHLVLFCCNSKLLEVLLLSKG